MAHDILLGTSSRNWARNAEPPVTVSGTGGKTALGGMVLGVVAGLAMITWPWWSRQPVMGEGARSAGKPYHHTDYTGKRLPPMRLP